MNDSFNTLSDDVSSEFIKENKWGDEWDESDLTYMVCQALNTTYRHLSSSAAQLTGASSTAEENAASLRAAFLWTDEQSERVVAAGTIKGKLEEFNALPTNFRYLKTQDIAKRLLSLAVDMTSRGQGNTDLLR
jgi:hypothetical protein